MEQFWSRSNSQRRCSSDCHRIELDVRLLILNQQKKDSVTQETFPELRAAAEALEKLINLTVTQIAQVRQSFKRKRTFLGSRREAFPAFTLREAPEKLLAVRERGIPFRLARPASV